MIKYILDVLDQKIEFYEKKLSEEETQAGKIWLMEQLEFHEKLYEALTPLDEVKNADH